MEEIAVIGGGIVGSTTAFYLAKEGYNVVLYDQDKFQGTKAAVGIICPWVNQRRSKAWYDLVRKGAAFYPKLLKDLDDNQSYVTNGTLIVNPKQHDKLWKIAVKRQKDAPDMGQVTQIANQGQWYDFKVNWKKGIYVSGGGQVNGLALRNQIIKQAVNMGVTFKKEKATIVLSDQGYIVNGKKYSKIVIAVGPWLNDLLANFTQERYKVTKQRGVLAIFDLKQTQSVPVIIPAGEYDYLFNEKGHVVVGATHENCDVFSQDHDLEAYNSMISHAINFIPSLKDADIIDKKIGYRAQSSDNIPFYGCMATHPDIYLASGLGSSGLTTGPLIAYRLAQMIKNGAQEDDLIYTPNNYIYMDN